MSILPRFCKSLMHKWMLERTTWKLPWTPPTRIIHYHSIFHFQILTQFLLKLLICSLFIYTIIMTIGMFLTQFSLEEEEMSLLANIITPNGNNSGGKQVHFHVGNKTSEWKTRGNEPKQINAETRKPMEKNWMRISDEVFIYSAHLDSRNFAELNPTQNNSSSSRRMNEMHTFSSTNNNRISDSDKLWSSIHVRIVGMKTVPPLREFIKTDILDWFRIKQEVEFTHKYECKLFFSSVNTGKLKYVPASRVTYTVIEEGVKVYAGCYINCYFINDSKVANALENYANLQVALYPKNLADYPTKLISVETVMIHDTKIEMSSSKTISYQKATLAICVRPLFGPFDDLRKLLQFISYYHVVGVTQFNFYLMSISSQIRKYLTDISREKTGSLRVILNEWNLPTGNTSELWDYGSLAALNDCLFSNIDQEFVVFVDIDEFIVPQKHESTQTGTLWDIIDSYNKTKTVQYLIRNTFFCDEFCPEQGALFKRQGVSRGETENVALVEKFATPLGEGSVEDVIERKPPLPIFRCNFRTKRIWNVALRSKFIVNPRQVLSVGHHLVTKYVNKKTDFRFTGYSVPVDPAVAIMNHYRECTSISSKKHPVLTRTRESDKTILKFERQVIYFVERLLSSITV